MAYTTRLSGGDANFQSMMENGFGIVTVMNALVFNGQDAAVLKNMTAYDVVKNYTEAKNKQNERCPKLVFWFSFSFIHS